MTSFGDTMKKDSDEVEVKEFKRLVMLFLSPPKPPQHVLKRAVKYFKIVVLVWWVFTLFIAIGLRFDYQNNPELWHYVEGLDGEQLLADEEAARLNTGPDLLALNFYPEQKNKYPEWMYRTSKFKTIEHFTGLILGRVGLYFMFTFLMLALKLRLTTWQLEYARQKIKEATND